MTHKSIPPKRVKAQPKKLFGGLIVNQPAMKEALDNCTDAKITRLKKAGMPYIPDGAGDLFDLEAALDWFRNRQKQVNVQSERKRR